MHAPAEFGYGQDPMMAGQGGFMPPPSMSMEEYMYVQQQQAALGMMPQPYMVYEEEVPVRRQSFCGPETLEDQQVLMRRNSSRRINSQSTGRSESGLARHGSQFKITRERDTQRTISERGFDDGDINTIHSYYGDMAKRSETRCMDGIKAVKSYRGDIAEGTDVGKPRVHPKSRTATGYGGISYKRDCAMRNGEHWGGVNVSKSGPKKVLRVAPLPQQPMMIEEPPVMPHVYNQEEVRTYSNLSDAFASDAFDEEDEEDEEDDEDEDDD